MSGAASPVMVENTHVTGCALPMFEVFVEVELESFMKFELDQSENFSSVLLDLLGTSVLPVT